jgi:hypothetical protein
MENMGAVLTFQNPAGIIEKETQKDVGTNMCQLFLKGEYQVEKRPST